MVMMMFLLLLLPLLKYVTTTRAQIPCTKNRRAFKPEYEKAARFLGAVPADTRNRVVPLRLDCAVDVRARVCVRVCVYMCVAAATATAAVLSTCVFPFKLTAVCFQVQKAAVVKVSYHVPAAATTAPPPPFEPSCHGAVKNSSKCGVLQLMQHSLPCHQHHRCSSSAPCRQTSVGSTRSPLTQQCASLSFSHTQSQCVCVCVCHSLSLSLTLNLSVCVCHSLSLSFSLSHPLT
jgi:hypothetical protein